jgi:hypothetical protein
VGPPVSAHRYLNKVTSIKQPFEQIVAQHGAMVFRVCRAVLAPRSNARDAWYEIFLRRCGSTQI